MEKAPSHISIEQIRQRLLLLEGIDDVHHIHLRSIDGQHNYITMHIVTAKDSKVIKDKVRAELKLLDIDHVTLELEMPDEGCDQYHCRVEYDNDAHAHHHHHQHEHGNCCCH